MNEACEENEGEENCVRGVSENSFSSGERLGGGGNHLIFGYMELILQPTLPQTTFVRFVSQKGTVSKTSSCYSHFSPKI